MHSGPHDPPTWKKIEDSSRCCLLRVGIEAEQCGCPAGSDPVEYLAQYLTDRVYSHLSGLPLTGTVGVMIGAYHNAVGHAILDPFHFYNLFRHRFDHLVLVHPPLVNYSRPTIFVFHRGTTRKSWHAHRNRSAADCRKRI